MSGRKAWLRVIVVAGIAMAVLALMVPGRGLTQQRASISGNHPMGAQVSSWAAAPADLSLNMTAVLALRNLPELNKLKTELQQPGSPNYHHWLTSQEFAQRFGPTPQQLQAVTGWLSANGFTIVNSDLPTRSIHFTGTVAQAEQAMGVNIVSHGTQYTNLNDPQVPAELSGTIVAFFGLSNFAIPAAKPNLARGGAQPNATIDGKTHFAPADFWTFYEESDPTAAGGNGGTSAPDCVGILELATEPAIPSPAPTASVIDIFTSQFSLPAAEITTILTDPKVQPAQPSDNEPVLDVDWAHSVAPNTPINLYISTIPNSTSGAFDTLALAVSDNACGAISSSIDNLGSDCPDLAQVQAFAQVSSQGVTQGQTLFHSSGDYGSFYPCGEPTTTPGETNVQPSVEEASANPDVTVVGGTQFDAVYDENGNNTSILSPGFEQVWQDYTPISPLPTPTPAPAKGTSGGGISSVFPVPSWQQGIVPYGMSSPLPMRGVPDVTAAASASKPGYWIATTSELATCPSGQTTCFTNDGGTSASAPIWAGISRLIAAKLGTTRLGNINPQLYAIAAGSSGALVDVSVLGNNCTFDTCSAYPGYQVGPGYDLGTGLGSPNIDKLTAAFEAPTPGAIATASNTTSSGTAGQTVSGGTLTVNNTSGTVETISSINVAISKPALFSALALSASINGGTSQNATAGTIGSTTTFTFSPALSVPVDGTVVFTLSATLGGLARAERSIRFAGIAGLPRGWSGGVTLLFALGMIGLAMLMVKRNRRRMLLGATALLLIAAAQSGCGGSSGGGNVTGTSEQTVPNGGVAVTTSSGAIIVQGLPATMGQITLK